MKYLIQTSAIQFGAKRRNAPQKHTALIFTCNFNSFVRKSAMATKLTLSLDKKVIEQAKIYAKEKHVSLSFLVENYLQKLVSEYKSNTENGSSIVEELAGIVKLSADYDYKDDYADYLSKKYE